MDGRVTGCPFVCQTRYEVCLCLPTTFRQHVYPPTCPPKCNGGGSVFCVGGHFRFSQTQLSPCPSCVRAPRKRGPDNPSTRCARSGQRGEHAGLPRRLVSEFAVCYARLFCGSGERKHEPIGRFYTNRNYRTRLTRTITAWLIVRARAASRGLGVHPRRRTTRKDRLAML
jgi:hypothetical protein